MVCWLAWTIIVFVLYELVYSFYRRWCVSKCLSSSLSWTTSNCVPERPHIIPLYPSSSGLSFTSTTSYTNFCFMQYVRHSAFIGENGGPRDGLAETFWLTHRTCPPSRSSCLEQVSVSPCSCNYRLRIRNTSV